MLESSSASLMNFQELWSATPCLRARLSVRRLLHTRVILSLVIQLPQWTSHDILQKLTGPFRSSELQQEWSVVLSYWKLQDNLYIDRELVLYGQRIIIPIAFHWRTLSHLNNSHRGVEVTKCHARQTVFWPGIDFDIKNTIEVCKSRQVLQPS